MTFTRALADLAAACAVAPAGLSDAELVLAQRALAGARHSIESSEAAVAAELAKRSRPELGKEGLAQRLGARTAENLVQQLTGSSSASARRLVRVGTLVDSLTSAASLPDSEAAEPWLAPTIALPVEAIDVIRAGLGAPSESVTSAQLASAAQTLADEAATTPVDRLAARARELRDDLDFAGIALREEERRARRYLRLIPQIDGMTRLSGLLDPESAAVLTTAIDNLTSPRRGGPRFVHEEDRARAEGIVADERTTEQLALDGLIEMIDVAVRAPSHKLFGSHRPEVRVLVTLSDLERGVGPAFIEGQSERVSVHTAIRHACGGGFQPIVFGDNGQAMHLGRVKRLHQQGQRIAIAARDGACVAFDCDRPPSWSEVHHVIPWEEGGETTVEDGVLLCRHHHMLVHNNGWRITRDGADYSMVPPVSVDPVQVPIPLRKKSAPLRRLLAG